MTDTASDAAKSPHPLIVRITHWVNAFAMVLMIGSGWRIYNASPLFDFRFPNAFTFGGWLGGALQWHFAAMWLLVINGLVYLLYGLWSGHLKASLFPIRPLALLIDMRAAFAFKLDHASGTYNTVQKALYLAVLVIGGVIVLSGLAVWKPIQFHLLASLFGGYEGARIVHFICMSAIVAFIALHLALVAIVPSVFWPMVTGRAPRHKKEAAQ